MRRSVAIGFVLAATAWAGLGIAAFPSRSGEVADLPVAFAATTPHVAPHKVATSVCLVALTIVCAAGFGRERRRDDGP